LIRMSVVSASSALKLYGRIDSMATAKAITLIDK